MLLHSASPFTVKMRRDGECVAEATLKSENVEKLWLRMPDPLHIHSCCRCMQVVPYNAAAKHKWPSLWPGRQRRKRLSTGNMTVE